MQVKYILERIFRSIRCSRLLEFLLTKDKYGIYWNFRGLLLYEFQGEIE